MHVQTQPQWGYGIVTHSLPCQWFCCWHLPDSRPLRASWTLSLLDTLSGNVSVSATLASLEADVKGGGEEGGEGGRSKIPRSSSFGFCLDSNLGIKWLPFWSFCLTSLTVSCFSLTSSLRSMEPSLLTLRFSSSLTYFHDRGCEREFHVLLHPTVTNKQIRWL